MPETHGGMVLTPPADAGSLLEHYAGGVDVSNTTPHASQATVMVPFLGSLVTLKDISRQAWHGTGRSFGLSVTAPPPWCQRTP
jgi:hypothetical protein